MTGIPPKLDFHLHRKQGEAFLSEATEIFYGGAAGGGKSHLFRVASIIWALEIPGLQVYLFRRNYKELRQNHMDGEGAYPMLLQSWVDQKLVQINYSGMRINFPNRSVIHLCHANNPDDVWNYLGVDIHVLILDELTQFHEWMYRVLRSRLRVGGLPVPEKYQGEFPRVLAASNPGGIGHNWVKKTFVDPMPPGEIHRAPDDEGGLLRQFIPALLTDNPTLRDNDPDYANRLKGLGDPAMVKAMLEGDWNIVSGGALDDVWTPSKHVIRTIDPPPHWKVVRSFDWGSSKPFSVGWTAIANGEEMTLPDGRKWCPPAGTRIRLREWYGCVPGKSNTGLKLSATEVARKIKEKERAFGWNVDILPGGADSAIFSTDEGEDVASKMATVGVIFEKAPKGPGSRARRLEVLRDYLFSALESPMEDPGIFICDCCRDTIAQLPVLPRDSNKPDEVDTDAEDHIFDELTYELTTEYTEPGYAAHIEIA